MPDDAYTPMLSDAGLPPVRVVRLPHAADLPLPSYATDGAAGFDLMAAVSGHVAIPPGGRALIPTGLCVALPPGCELQVRTRSGLAKKDGVVVANSPGTVDQDYRGEVGVILANIGNALFSVTRGMRVAQGVLARVERRRWVEVEALDETARGAGGFGSTGQ